MSTATTYATLQSDMAKYLDRADEEIIGQIPRLITMAEWKCARVLKALMAIRYAKGTFQENQAVMPKPGRWLDTTTFNVATTVGGSVRETLFLRTYDYIRSYWPDAAQVGSPAYYADYGMNHWIVAPTPAAGLAFEVGYYERPEPLSKSNQTNWLTEQAPDLLLKVSLLEASPYIKADERIGMWQQDVSAILGSLGVEDARRALDSQSIGGTR